MKLKELICEKASPIIYHFTSTAKARKVCQENRFKLAMSLGTRTDSSLGAQQGRNYFLSTTRHKLGGYHVDNVYDDSVMFTLNGDLLNQKYRSKPVDYWGPSFRKVNPLKFEAEDRVYSTEPYITDAKKYIIEVHIYFGKFDGKSSRIILDRRTLIQCLKKSGIPYWVYGNRNDFLTQNKAKAITLDLSKFKVKDKIDNKRTNFSSLSYDKRDINAWIELWFKSPGSKLSETANKLANRLKYDYQIPIYRQDILVQLENIIHNRKNDENFVNSFKTLSDIMRKNKFASLIEFINAIFEKWKVRE